MKFLLFILGLGFATGMATDAYAVNTTQTSTSYMHAFRIDSVFARSTNNVTVIVPKYTDEPIEALLKRVDTQDPDLFYALYILYGRKNEPLEALKWLHKAAELNHLQGQLLLGQSYLNGKIAERNCDEAIKWLSLAAEKANATTIQSRQLSQSYEDMKMQFHGEEARKDLGKALAFDCGHDFMATVRLWKDDEQFLSTLHNAKVGYADAQDGMVYHYRDRAADLGKEANFWLHLATASNEKFQWVSASQLMQGEIIDLEKDLGTPNKNELVPLIKEKNLKTLALLSEAAFEVMDLAFQGDTKAQYRLSRLLFEEAIRSYEEGYFWGLLKFKRSADWEKPVYKETIDKPLQFLTAEQVQAIRERAEAWRNLPR